MIFKDFQEYLIMVGIRSHEFTYSDDELFEGISHFKNCFNRNFSPYSALLILNPKKKQYERYKNI